MTPTLFGRIQTRLFLLGTVGVVWTAIIVPFLPVPPGVGLGEVYRLSYVVLAIVAGVGVIWELIYHGLQQFRWEKDWPTLFGFLTGINEGLVAGLLAPDAVPGGAFVVHFATTWLVVWLFANGPMRVLFLRWRFNGGRVL